MTPGGTSVKNCTAQKNIPGAAVARDAALPCHVAVIMDGNGRWANRRGAIRTDGHSAGMRVFEEMARTLSDAGVEYLTVYAFSTENWDRPQMEVRALMSHFEAYLDRILAKDKLDGENYVFRVIGDRSKLSKKLVKKIEAAEKKTLCNDGLIINLAVSYGGKWEIADAAARIAKDYKDSKLAFIDEGVMERYIREINDAPPPDLLIRTGGEKRLSGFLMWQLAYAELYFTDVLFPDFSAEDLNAALEEYKIRVRRFGKVDV